MKSLPATPPTQRLSQELEEATTSMHVGEQARGVHELEIKFGVAGQVNRVLVSSIPGGQLKWELKQQGSAQTIALCNLAMFD